MPRVEGKLTWVTGASSGIGVQIAKAGERGPGSSSWPAAETNKTDRLGYLRQRW